MKKCILLLVALLIVGSMTVGGTLAYRVDVDEEGNALSAQNGIDITLHAMMRSADPAGNTFVDFAARPLLPVVGEVGAQLDTYGIPTNGNFVDKLMLVSSTQESADAYVRMIVGVPTALKDAVHLYFTKNESEWQYQYTYELEIEGVPHTLTAYIYQKVLQGGSSTSPCLVGCYLDAGVNWDDRAGCYTLGGKPLAGFTGAVTVPVAVQAVQVNRDQEGNITDTPHTRFTPDESHNPWKSNGFSLFDWLK